MARGKLTPVPPGAIVLTLEQAAERAQVHPETLRRAIWKKQLAHARLGNRIRIRPEALEAWIGRQTQTTNPRRKGAEA